MYVTQIYCESVDCNVREVEVRTKDFDQVDPREWYCPACRKPAKIHWRQTGDEHRKYRLRHAIGLVNAALYAREHPDPQFPRFGTFVPFSALTLEQLPDHWTSVIPPPKKPEQL